MVATNSNPLHLVGDEDSSKRRQILDGARKVFMDLGFDGASMNEIARSAGVSKGTLYVYFADKNRLFEAIVEERSARARPGHVQFRPRARCRDHAAGIRQGLYRTAVPAGRRLRHPHRDGDRRADAGRRPPLLRKRAGKNHPPPRRLSAGACRAGRSCDRRLPTRGVAVHGRYARRRCSCRSFFRPPPPLRPSASKRSSKAQRRCFWLPIARRRFDILSSRRTPESHRAVIASHRAARMRAR